MKMFFKIAVVAAIACTNQAWSQDFSKFAAGPESVTDEVVIEPAYASISDTEAEARAEAIELQPFEVEPATYEESQMFTQPAVALTGASIGCDDGSCASLWTDACDDGGCSSCSSSAACCGGPQCGALCARQCPECCGVGTHYSYAYGQFLYLRPRNAEVAYAVPIDGPIAAPPAANPIQIGGIGVLDPDYEPGFRAGFNLALDTVSSLDVSYTLFESHTTDQISTQAPDVLRSLVAHPSTSSAATDFLSASADLEIDFDTIDLAYRHLLVCREVFAANYVLGARYGKLEQRFDSLFVNNGTETVSTDIDFDGGGLRLGLETERYSCRNQLHVFANGYASFLAGRFQGSYFQGQSFDPTVVNTSWEAGRIVPILDLEMGVGWTSLEGKLRMSAGYMVSAWFNTVTTHEFIKSIQGSDYADLGQATTFDGLNARFEWRF